jgi:hypothetical protein
MTVQNLKVFPPGWWFIQAYSSQRPPTNEVLLGTPTAVTNDPRSVAVLEFVAIDSTVCAPVFGTTSKS